MVQGRCMKCKKNVEIKNPVFELNKRGSPVAHGKCGVCGTTVYRMLGRDDCPADLRAKADKFKENKAKKGGAGKSRGSRKSKKSRKSRADDDAPKKRRKSRASKKSKKSRGSRKSRK